MSIKLRATSVGLVELVDWVGMGMMMAARDPSIMVPMAHAIGRSSAFANQTNVMVSEWQQLSELTNDIREARGYQRYEPILWQSGQLRSAAFDVFVRWQSRQKQSTRSWTSPDTGHPLYEVSTIANGTLTAAISGSRVQNQFGGTLPSDVSGFTIHTRGRDRPSHLPARPFFGIDKSKVDKAVPAMMPLFLTAWRSQAHTALGAH